MLSLRRANHHFALAMGVGANASRPFESTLDSYTRKAYYTKIASGRKADTVTLGRSTMLLTLRSTATLQMT